MRTVSVFGSTGSIGCNTLSLLGAEHHVKVLTAARNAAKLADQAIAHKAELAVIEDETLLPELTSRLSGTSVRATAGQTALIEAAQEPVDWAMSAIIGSAGLAPTLALAGSARTLALANKESMVCAGELVNAKCAASGCQLIPVDSEHSAIFQALAGQDSKQVRRVLLTSSGGPFRTWSLAQMKEASLADTLNHPNFSMGQRITIDSATMFNKALEVIEAQQLFAVTSEQIDVVVHPQQIVHSMVEFQDMTILAQLGSPDMRGAIGYALHYPQRKPLPIEPLDFMTLSRLDFEPPDETRFPALRLAREVLVHGGLTGTVFNAAKEVALDKFIAGHIGFLDMADLIAYVLDRLVEESAVQHSTEGLDIVMGMDKSARDIGQTWRPT